MKTQTETEPQADEAHMHDSVTERTYDNMISL